MIQLIIAAFTIGLVGSFHCIGMCGPLALSLPINQNSITGKITGAILYNSGRITTYTVLGFLFGMIGQSAAIFGYQQGLSMCIGIIIVLFLVLGKIYKNHAVSIPFLDTFFNKVRIRLGELFKSNNSHTLYLIGLLNGLLPCGLVYMAIAGSIAAGSIAKGMLFMAFFGLGTLPVMYSVIFFGNYISIAVRQKIRMAYPYLMMLIACLLIIRGLGLGIPYLSPAFTSANQLIPVCCTKP